MGERATIDQDYLHGAADAIRRKNGTSNTYTPAQFEAAIDAIPTGGITPTGTINITENGSVDVTQYATANVNVSGGGGQPNPATWQTGMIVKAEFDALHAGGGASMQLTKNADYTVSVVWNGGGNVGAAIYWAPLVPVDNITSIGVKFRATAHYSMSFPVRIGIATVIAGDDSAQSFTAQANSLDISGDEVALSLDLISYTGNYYIIIRADGVSCTLYDFEINYAQ